MKKPSKIVKTWLTVEEAAEYLSISKPTLYAYMKSGDLPFKKLKGMTVRRIKVSDLDKLLVDASEGSVGSSDG